MLLWWLESARRNMKRYKIISWSRDKKGKIINRNFNDICNAVTTFSGNGGTTCIWVLRYEDNKDRKLKP